MTEETNIQPIQPDFEQIRKTADMEMSEHFNQVVEMVKLGSGRFMSRVN
jgi:hypothetical protein